MLEGYSAAEISREIASSRSAVLKYLKHFQIPLRPVDSKNKSRMAYGEAWRDRETQRNLREYVAISKMRVLRSQGLSYGKIAGVLNTMGIPTKTRKGAWSGKQVHQILIRTGLQSESQNGNKNIV